MRTRHRISPAAAAVLAVAVLLLNAGPAAAHGAAHTVIDRLVADDGLAVEFYLSTGEPLAGSGYKVYGPGDASVAYQEGHTDRLGRASFLPDRAGNWRVELADDRGHTGTATVEVGAGQIAPAEPLWRRWLLRVSLLANVLALGLLLHTWITWRWRAQVANAGHPHGHHHHHDDNDHHHDHDHTHHHGEQHTHRPSPVGAIGTDVARG